MLSDFEMAIDRFERAVRDCPDEHWNSSLWVVKRTDPWMWPRGGDGDGRTEEAIQVFSAFWLVAYHCLFFLDLYCWDERGAFATPPEFANGPEDQGIDDFGAARFPNVKYSRDQLLGYVDHCRRRVRETLANLTDSQRAIQASPRASTRRQDLRAAAGREPRAPARARQSAVRIRRRRMCHAPLTLTVADTNLKDPLWFSRTSPRFHVAKAP